MAVGQDKSNLYVLEDKQSELQLSNIFRLVKSLIYKDASAAAENETKKTQVAFSTVKYLIEEGVYAGDTKLYATYNDALSREIWVRGVEYMLEPEAFNKTEGFFIDNNPYYFELYNKYGVNIYTARMAEDQEILHYDDNYSDYLEDGEVDLFLECYQRSLEYYNQVLRTNAFDADPLYAPLMRCIIVLGAVEKYLTKKAQATNDVELFDQYSINNFLYSYGLQELVSLPVFMQKNIYQKRIIQRFADLLQYRGSKKVIDIITEIFSYSDLEVKKYFICKDDKGALNFYLSDYTSDSFFANLENSNQESYRDFLANEPDKAYWYNSEPIVASSDFNKANSKFLSFEIKADIFKGAKFLSELFAYAIFDNSNTNLNSSNLLDKYRRKTAKVNFRYSEVPAPDKGTSYARTYSGANIPRLSILDKTPAVMETIKATPFRGITDMESLNASAFNGVEGMSNFDLNAMGEISYIDYFNALKFLYLVSNNVLEYTESIILDDTVRPPKKVFNLSSEAMLNMLAVVETNKLVSSAVLVDHRYSQENGGYVRLVENNTVAGNGFYYNTTKHTYDPMTSRHVVGKSSDPLRDPFAIRFNMRADGKTDVINKDSFADTLPSYMGRTYNTKSVNIYGIDYSKFINGCLDTSLITDPMCERCYVSGDEKLVVDGGAPKVYDASNNLVNDYSAYEDYKMLECVKIALRATVCYDNKDFVTTSVGVASSVFGIRGLRSDRFIEHATGTYTELTGTNKKTPTCKVYPEYLDMTKLRIFGTGTLALDTKFQTVNKDTAYFLTSTGDLIPCSSAYYFILSTDGTFIKSNMSGGTAIGSLFVCMEYSKYKTITPANNVIDDYSILENHTIYYRITRDTHQVSSADCNYDGCKLLNLMSYNNIPAAGYIELDDLSVVPLLSADRFGVGSIVVNGDCEPAFIESTIGNYYRRQYIECKDATVVGKKYVKTPYTFGDAIEHIYKHWGFTTEDNQLGINSNGSVYYGKDITDGYAPDVTKSEISILLLGDISGITSWDTDRLANNTNVSKEYCKLVEYCFRMGFKIIRNCQYVLDGLCENSKSPEVRENARALLSTLFITQTEVVQKIKTVTPYPTDNTTYTYDTEIRKAFVDETGKIVYTGLPPDPPPADHRKWYNTELNKEMHKDNVQTLGSLFKIDSLSKILGRIKNPEFKKFIIAGISYRFSIKSGADYNKNLGDILINDKFVNKANIDTANNKITCLLLLLYNTFMSEPSFQSLLSPSMKDADNQMMFLQEVLDVFRAYTVKYKNFAAIPIIEDSTSTNIGTFSDGIVGYSGKVYTNDVNDFFTTKNAAEAEKINTTFLPYNMLSQNKTKTIDAKRIGVLDDKSTMTFIKTRYSSLGRGDKIVSVSKEIK